MPLRNGCHGEAAPSAKRRLFRMKNWVVLATRAGSEQKAIGILKDDLEACGFIPFAPIKEKAQRQKGVITKKAVQMFPGYVLLQTELEASQIMDELRLGLRRDTESENRRIISILHYGDDKQDVVMREAELLVLERLLNDDFCFKGSVGFIVGDKIEIVSGPLKGLESQIKYINRHRREATIELGMMGAMREVRVMLEIIKKC